MSILIELIELIFGDKQSKDNGHKDKRGSIEYGKNKKDGGHDHRTNKGEDRTPSQQEGDRKRRKK